MKHKKDSALGDILQFGPVSKASSNDNESFEHTSASALALEEDTTKQEVEGSAFLAELLNGLVARQGLGEESEMTTQDLQGMFAHSECSTLPAANDKKTNS